MILIEAIPVVAARLIAEQKAREWLARSRRRAPEVAARDGSLTPPAPAPKLPRKAA